MIFASCLVVSNLNLQMTHQLSGYQYMSGQFRWPLSVLAAFLYTVVKYLMGGNEGGRAILTLGLKSEGPLCLEGMKVGMYGDWWCVHGQARETSAHVCWASCFALWIQYWTPFMLLPTLMWVRPPQMPLTDTCSVIASRLYNLVKFTTETGHHIQMFT